MKKILLLICLAMTSYCFSQNNVISQEYKTICNGKELSIRLFADTTYEFVTYWGTYHGNYHIVSDSPYDWIYFYDDGADRGLFHYGHISICDTSQIQTDGNAEDEQPYVCMFEITGSSVVFHYVCFEDSIGTVDCYKNEDNSTRHVIPENTNFIEMCGDLRSFPSQFRIQYYSDEGSIAFIIFPLPSCFRITKERDKILYRPCNCSSFESDCVVSFSVNKHNKGTSFDF